MKIKRRFPSFFEGFEETEHVVNTREELLSLDWVKNYEKIVGHMGLYYAPNPSKLFRDAPDFLMSLVRQNDGEVIYFVVGYIYGSGKDLGLEDYNNFIKRD